VRCEALTKKGALRIGDGEAILVGYDAVPQGADVAHLVFRRQVVKTGRGKGERVSHAGRIARGVSAANTGVSADFAARPTMIGSQPLRYCNVRGPC